MRLILATALLLAWAPATAWANPRDLWIEEAAPSSYDKTMGTADQLALQAVAVLRRRLRGSARRLARRAIAAYQRAAKIDSSKAEPHYRAAELLHKHTIEDFDHPNHSDMRQAIAHWTAFERLAPLDPRLEEVLFRRSIVHTKLGGEEHFRRGIADYDAALELIDQSSIRHRKDQLARLLSNRAEILMAVGNLDAAITGYMQALRYQNEPLYGYGLAVALDRDGQSRRAREVMSHYARMDHEDSLVSETVFFVPEGEVNYYKALRAEALGRPRRAITAYTLFLRKLPDSRWAAKARQNRAGLEQKGR